MNDQQNVNPTVTTPSPDAEGHPRAVGKPPPPFVMTGDLCALFTSLAKAQSAYGPIPKTRTVTVKSDKGNYTFDYAPLDVVLEATRPALSANGIAFVQPIYDDGDGLMLRTMLVHAQGGRIETMVPLPSTDKAGQRLDIQKIGAAITYLRRYSAVALLGCVADEDDDGAAEGTQSVAPRPAPMGKTQAAPPAVTKPATSRKPAPVDNVPPTTTTSDAQKIQTAGANVTYPRAEVAQQERVANQQAQGNLQAQADWAQEQAAKYGNPMQSAPERTVHPDPIPHDPATGEVVETPPALPTSAEKVQAAPNAVPNTAPATPAKEELEKLYGLIRKHMPDKAQAAVWIRENSGGMLPSEVSRHREKVLHLVALLGARG